MRKSTSPSLPPSTTQCIDLVVYKNEGLPKWLSPHIQFTPQSESHFLTIQYK